MMTGIRRTRIYALSSVCVLVLSTLSTGAAAGERETPLRSSTSSPTSFHPDEDGNNHSKGNVLSDGFDGVDTLASLTAVTNAAPERVQWRICPTTAAEPLTNATLATCTITAGQDTSPTVPLGANGTGEEAYELSYNIPAALDLQTRDVAILACTGAGENVEAGGNCQSKLEENIFFDDADTLAGTPSGNITSLNHGDSVSPAGFTFTVSTSADLNSASALRAARDFGADSDADPSTADQSVTCSISQPEDVHIEWICTFPDAGANDDNKPMAVWVYNLGDGATGTSCSDLAGGECVLDSIFVVSEPRCPGFANDERNQVVGTSAKNVLDGTPGPDIICGLAGNDTISGAGANDLLIGGDGNDSLEGGNGVDTITGDAGKDAINGGAGADPLDGGTGYDTTGYSGSGTGVVVDLRLKPGGAPGQQMDGSGGWAQGDTLFSFERITGTSSGDLLIGNAESNILKGLGQDDILRGNQANDTLQGGAHCDELEPGGGNDTLDYTDAPSAVQVNIGPTNSLNGAASCDSIVGAGGTAAGFENVKGSKLADTIHGNALPNRLYGYGGVDIMDGLTANDFLYGGNDNDNLQGGPQDDHVHGEGGDDNIDGGDGTDHCTQGPGAGPLTNCEES